MRWRHTGFHFHSKVKATSKQEAERVGKYMIRPILSLKRLSIDKAKGKVCYQYGKGSAELEQMDYLEFIARVTSHIPDKGQVMIRYHGGFMPTPTGERCARQVYLPPIHRSLRKRRDLCKIISHLKLTFMAERPPPPQIVRQEFLMAAEEREEYF